MKKILFVLLVSVALIGLPAISFAQCNDKACSEKKCSDQPCTEKKCGDKACTEKKCSDQACTEHKCNDACRGTHRTPKGGSKADVTFDYTKGLPQVEGTEEKTGVVEVKFYGAYHKIDSVVLRSGSESIKLIHSAKHSMRDIEKMNGKKVSVRGKTRPISRKHKELAFEVIHLNEIQ